MKKLFIFIVSICLQFFSFAHAFSDEPGRTKGSAKKPDCIPGELIVKYKPGVVRKTASELTNRLGISTLKKIKFINADHIRLPSHMTVDEALTIYRNNPDVEWVEPNYIRRAMAAAPPTDTFFDNLWGLYNSGQKVNDMSGKNGADIDMLEAWEKTTDCSNIVIAIIDSGVDLNHPDLKNNLWTNPDEIADNGIDDDGNGYIDDIHGWNFVDNNNDLSDSNDHGTHSAGVIAAQGNNSLGTTGVCWSAKIMPLKFLDTHGTGSSVDEINAIEYAVKNGAKIINASFGEKGYLTGEYNAIQEAGNAGLLFIAAAGNFGFDNDAKPLDEKTYPGSYDLDNIISVAASDQSERLPSWSNYGATTVDVAAPGANIYGPIPNRESIWKELFYNDEGWDLTGTWELTTISHDSSHYSLSTSPSGDYDPDLNITARSPSIDLTGKRMTLMKFFLQGSSEKNYDKLYLETSTSTDGPWTNQTVEVLSSTGQNTHFKNGIGGTYSTWAGASVLLTILDGSSKAYIRFRFETDSNNATNETYNGWSVDDIKIEALDDSYPPPEENHYMFLNGTSFATPFVSGVAGLIWSETPGLSFAQVKDSIINGVEKLPAFEDKVFSGGRINANTSLDISLSLKVPSTSGSSSNGNDDGSNGSCFIRTSMTH